MEFHAATEASSSRQRPLRIRVSSSLAEFADIWPRTDQFGKASCYAFQCSDLLEVWRNTIGAASNIDTLFAVVEDDARPVLLLPLGIKRRHNIRILTFLDGDVCDYNGPVVFPSEVEWDARTIGAVWKALQRALPPADIAMFEKLPEDICGVPNPMLELGSAPYTPSGYVMTLKGTWEDFAARRLPNRQDSRRQRRKLAEIGRVAFSIAETGPERNDMLAAMIRQKTRRFRETETFNRFDQRGYRDYFVEVTESLASRASLHLSALSVDGNIVATHWGIVANRRFYFLMPTYEGGQWSRYSPGRLLMENLIEWSFANGIEVFDFGIGDEPYKMKLHDRVINLYQCTLPITLRGHAYAAALNAKQAIRDTKAWSLFKSAVSRRGQAQVKGAGH